MTPCPEFNLDNEFKLHEAITALITSGLISGAHDISEGGLFVSLTESAVAGSLGYSVQLPSGTRKDLSLFSESQGRIVISLDKENLTKAEDLLRKQGIPVVRLGTVTERGIAIDDIDFGDTGSWKTLYQNALSNILEQ